MQVFTIVSIECEQLAIIVARLGCGIVGNDSQREVDVFELFLIVRSCVSSPQNLRQIRGVLDASGRTF